MKTSQTKNSTRKVKLSSAKKYAVQQNNTNQTVLQKSNQLAVTSTTNRSVFKKFNQSFSSTFR